MQEEAHPDVSVRRLPQRVPKHVRAEADRTTEELQTRPDTDDVRRTGRGQNHYTVT